MKIMTKEVEKMYKTALFYKKAEKIDERKRKYLSYNIINTIVTER